MAKLPADLLDQLLSGIHWGAPSDKVIVGLETGDDAAVYQLNADCALIFTTDFFPPPCADAELYGEIAAVNAISDIYAMAATPIAALNIVLYPNNGYPMEGLQAILTGGAKAAERAGIPIVGGHTIANGSPVYGLAVVGIASPQRIATNAQLRPGMQLILTKPLGTGTILAAHRLGFCSEESFNKAKETMLTLNSHASRVMNRYNIRAATDITGFSLAGHALRMAKASQCTIRIESKKLPSIPGALSLIDDGCIPGATFTNQRTVGDEWSVSQHLSSTMKYLLLDPQTSGGILMGVEAEKVSSVLEDLHAENNPAIVIGEATERDVKPLIID